MTAIEARRRLAIFDNIFDPAFPKNLFMCAAKRNPAPARKMFITIAEAVMKKPCSLTRRIEVVRITGPVINGTPKDTVPRLAFRVP